MSGHFGGLEAEGKIERVTAGRDSVRQLHTVVDRDLATARQLREYDRDWALAIGYNAMLQACHALLAAHGYRARGEQQHRTMIEFVRIALPEQAESLNRLDRLRRQRHRTVYDVAGQVSAREVDETLALAETLLPVLKDAATTVLRSETER